MGRNLANQPVMKGSLLGEPVECGAYSLLKRPLGFDKYLRDFSSDAFPNQLYWIKIGRIRR